MPKFLSSGCASAATISAAAVLASWTPAVAALTRQTFDRFSALRAAFPSGAAPGHFGAASGLDSALASGAHSGSLEALTRQTRAGFPLDLRLAFAASPSSSSSGGGRLRLGSAGKRPSLMAKSPRFLPSNHSRTAARLWRSACRMGSGTRPSRQSTAVRRTAVSKLTRCPDETTTVPLPSHGRNSMASGSSSSSASSASFAEAFSPSGAHSLAPRRLFATVSAFLRFTSSTRCTDLATPTVGRFVRIPKWVAAPHRLGWKAPLPSTSTTCGAKAGGTSSSNVARAGTSRKAK
mmetsp:Transcript_15721/g.47138  ORF Transcript_15721/g.47138 Transcript_15721/m.47138 type:complete len:292 (-) Transcript_15721:315-1190(-)